MLVWVLLGLAGAWLAQRLSPSLLRGAVVVSGVVVGWLFWRC